MSGLASLFPDNEALVLQLETGLAKVEQRLTEAVTHSSDTVTELLSHLSKAGGKRLRPLLCLLCAQLGEDPVGEEVISAALAVELTHLASLYHDDVMDEAPLRRGVPTAQKLAGNTAAIMAGDILFSKASAIVSRLGAQAVLLHAQAFERLCLGELNEIIGCPPDTDPIAHYIQVLADKTGSLIALSAQHGVLAAGGDAQIAQAVAQYGEKIGVAFQLADDVIDLSADPQVTGKQAGTDLLENVPTMPTLLLRKAAAMGTLDIAGAEILALLDGGELAQGQNLELAVTKLREHEVVEQTRELAQQWANESLEYLTVLPAGVVKESLEMFAYAMVHRMA